MGNKSAVVSTLTNRSTLRVVAICVVLVCVVLSFAVWWNADSAGVPQRGPPAASAAFAVQSKEPVRERLSMPGEKFQTQALLMGRNSSSGTPRIEPPTRDLIEAIKRAREESGNPPTEQPSAQAYQPMSTEEAAKVFENAVKAAQENHQLHYSPASPFGSVKR